MGKSKKVTIGYWYQPAFHAGLGVGPIDAFLEFCGGDKTAWSGELTESGNIYVDSPELFGGEKDQGGIVGYADVMFGEATQMPSGYLASTFGGQQPAWRGLATFVWKNGKYGAMNPYPQKASYKLRKIMKGWDTECWYPEKAEISHSQPIVPAQILVTGNAKTLGGPMWATAQPGGAFQGFEQSTGANIPNASPAWFGGTWIAVHADGVRYRTATDAVWQAGTITADHAFGIVVGNSAGWLAPYNDKSNVPPFQIAAAEVPVVFTGVSPSATGTAGGDAGSTLGRSVNPMFLDGKYILGGEHAFLGAAGPSGPYTAIWDVASEVAAGRDPNWASIIDWYDIVGASSGWHAVIHWHFDAAYARLQVIRSADLDDWTTFDVLVDTGTGDSNKPAQLCVGGNDVVCYCSNGNLWTSANGWASAIVTGLTGPGIIDLETGALMPGGRRIVYAGGLFYCFGAGDKYVTFHAPTQTVTGPITLPIDTVFGAAVSAEVVVPGPFKAMNPAHILYYSRTQQDMGGEPTTAINAASFTAAADWFYAQGFGLCTSYDPSKESVTEFEARICRVAGCSLSRSLIDGQWYIDIANGEYDIGTLPILSDDDILAFEEQPAILDGVTNSVSIKYFDPEKKESIITPPVQAPALIQDFGTIHKTIEFPEIPTDTLAARVAQRELQASISAPKGYKLSTTRAPYAWRPGTYFRLQLAKRGISDMVCYFAEKSAGTLRSGAIAVTATQDVYSLPSTSFVSVEPGVDTRPDQAPQPITAQAAFEAPYTEVCAALPRAELEALPPDVGYLITVAADPNVSRDYALMVDDGAGYEQRDYGEWCATALISASGYLDSAFTLTSGVRLDQVAVGQPALWGSEIVRVDAIDAVTGAITLGRACADTVPAKHAAGDRIWFWQVGAAYDTTEYTDGEAINVKLLTNTGSQRLPITSATALTLTFDQRQFRPYPPADVTVNAASFPDSVTGDAVISAVARNRVTQADQLVDWSMATIAAEAGTTYSVRNVDVETDTQTHLTTGITAWPHTIPSADLRTLNRVEVWSVRDGVESWQRVQIPFTAGLVLLAETGDAITTEDGDAITME